MQVLNLSAMLPLALVDGPAQTEGFRKRRSIDLGAIDAFGIAKPNGLQKREGLGKARCREHLLVFVGT